MNKIKQFIKSKIDAVSLRGEYEWLVARAKEEGRDPKWGTFEEFLYEPLPKGSGEPSAEQVQEKADRMKAHYAESPLPWYSATTYKGLVQKFK